METKLALLAEYANVTRDGKLNLMGVSNTINARTLPWLQPQMQVILQFEVGSADWETEKDISIELIDASGKQLSNMPGKVKVTRPKEAKSFNMNWIMSINNMKFDNQGDYEFVIRLDGHIEKELPLRVNYMPPPSTNKQ